MNVRTSVLHVLGIGCSLLTCTIDDILAEKEEGVLRREAIVVIRWEAISSK